jgi:hypothetical protein
VGYLSHCKKQGSKAGAARIVNWWREPSKLAFYHSPLPPMLIQEPNMTKHQTALYEATTTLMAKLSIISNYLGVALMYNDDGKLKKAIEQLDEAHNLAITIHNSTSR